MGPIDQFNIIPYFSIAGLQLTNSALAMVLSCVCAPYILWLLPRFSHAFRALADVYYDFIENLAKQTIGHDYNFLIPFISSIFLFILFGNLLGLVPGFFTFTSHMSTNLTISSMVIGLVLIIAIVRHGVHMVHLFCPPSLPWWLIPLVVPIEMVSFFIRIFSLAIRLCINMCVGHMMFKVFLLLASQFRIAGPLVGIIYLPFFGLELCMAFLQAYIFTILSCVYLRDAVELHH